MSFPLPSLLALQHLLAPPSDSSSCACRLLHKDPSRRLTWPKIAQHPFVLETDDDRERSRAASAHELKFGGAAPPQFRLEQFLSGITPSQALPGIQSLPQRAQSAETVEQRQRGEGAPPVGGGARLQTPQEVIGRPDPEQPTPPAAHGRTYAGREAKRGESSRRAEAKEMGSGPAEAKAHCGEFSKVGAAASVWDSALEAQKVVGRANPEAMLKLASPGHFSALRRLLRDGHQVVGGWAEVEKALLVLLGFGEAAVAARDSAEAQRALGLVGSTLGPLVLFAEQQLEVVRRGDRGAGNLDALLTLAGRVIAACVQLPSWTGASQPLLGGSNGFDFPAGFSTSGGTVTSAGRRATTAVLTVLTGHYCSGVRKESTVAICSVLGHSTPAELDALVQHSQLLAQLCDGLAEHGGMAAHGLALIVHPVGRQWDQVYEFPSIAALTQPFKDDRITKEFAEGGDLEGSSLSDEDESLAWREKRVFDGRRELKSRVLREAAAALLFVPSPRPSALFRLCDLLGTSIASRDLSLGAACLRVLLQTTRESSAVASAVSAHSLAFSTLVAVLSLSGAADQTSYAKGLAMLLFSALLEQRALSCSQACAIIPPAASSLCDSSDVRLTAASSSLLSAAIGLSRRDPASEAAKELSEAVVQAVASPSAILAFRRLLCFRSDRWLERHKAKRRQQQGDKKVDLDRAALAEAFDGVAASLEGADFGGRVGGLLDGAVGLLAETVALSPATCPMLLEGRLWEPLCRQFVNAGHGELSPVGMLASLQLIGALLEEPRPSPPALFESLLKEGVLSLASALLHPPHMRALKRWPLQHGGGLRGVAELLNAVVHVVRLPLPPVTCPRDVLVYWQQTIYSEALIKGILISLRTLSKRLDEPPPHHPIDLLLRLVLLSSNYMNQFMALRGLSTLRDSDAFHESSPSRIIVCALLIACQAARASEAHYQALHNENLYILVYALLRHPEGAVRAKAANLVGNLCRHSSFFYGTLVTPLRTGGSTGGEGPPTLLCRLVTCCGDSDVATRKFACFAVGNAAFHSSELYPHLAPSVPLLVAALGDSDEKTRANAAGALGNLVRNSSILCSELLAHGVPARLLEAAACDPAPALRRIALFSLGTLSVYAKCRVALGLLEPPLDEALAGIEASARRAVEVDQQALDHVGRIRKKLLLPGVE